MERGRSEFLRISGVGIRGCSRPVSHWSGGAPHECRFDRPARMEDALTVRTAVMELTGARMRLDQRIARAGDTLAKAAVEVCVITLDGRPRRVPDSTRKKLEFFLELDNKPDPTEEPMRKLALAPILLLCLAATPAASLSDKPYISATDVDFPGLLPPPPTEASPAGKRDLQAILDLQKNMTPSGWPRFGRTSTRASTPSPAPYWVRNSPKRNFPMVGAFIDKVVKDGGVGVGPIKQKYKKLRPFQFSKEIQTPERHRQGSGWSDLSERPQLKRRRSCDDHRHDGSGEA